MQLYSIRLVSLQEGVNLLLQQEVDILPTHNFQLLMKDINMKPTLILLLQFLKMILHKI
jgi:hypothetical protein